MVKQHLGFVFQHDPDIAAKPHVTLGQPARTLFPSPLTSVHVPTDTSATMIC
jgi:hypothetical protein